MGTARAIANLFMFLLYHFIFSLSSEVVYLSERKKVVRSRKWLLTCNNPDKHGWSYSEIENSISDFTND